MKRSFIAITMAVFFAAVGLIVLNHTGMNVSPLTADDQNGFTIFEINCPASHDFFVPSTVYIELGYFAEANGNIVRDVYVNDIDLAVLTDTNADWDSAGNNINTAKATGNTQLWMIGPSVLSVAVCFGGYDGANSGLNIAANSVSNAGMNVSATEVASLPSDMSGFTQLSTTPAAIVTGASLEDDEMSIIYGMHATYELQHYAIGFDFPTPAANYVNSNVEFQSNVDTTP